MCVIHTSFESLDSKERTDKTGEQEGVVPFEGIKFGVVLVARVEFTSETFDLRITATCFVGIFVWTSVWWWI